MPLEFHDAVEEMEIWSATSDGYSFAISFFESFASYGFQGRPGYVASWRPLYGGRGAIKVIGSPFKSFDEAEVACDAMLKNLISDWQPGSGAAELTWATEKSKQASECKPALNKAP